MPPDLHKLVGKQYRYRQSGRVAVKSTLRGVKSVIVEGRRRRPPTPSATPPGALDPFESQRSTTFERDDVGRCRVKSNDGSHEGRLIRCSESSGSRSTDRTEISSESQDFTQTSWDLDLLATPTEHTKEVSVKCDFASIDDFAFLDSPNEEVMFPPNKREIRNQLNSFEPQALVAFDAMWKHHPQRHQKRQNSSQSLIRSKNEGSDYHRGDLHLSQDSGVAKSTVAISTNKEQSQSTLFSVPKSEAGGPKIVGRGAFAGLTLSSALARRRGMVDGEFPKTPKEPCKNNPQPSSTPKGFSCKYGQTGRSNIGGETESRVAKEHLVGSAKKRSVLDSIPASSYRLQQLSQEQQQLCYQESCNRSQERTTNAEVEAQTSSLQVPGYLDSPGGGFLDAPWPETDASMRKLERFTSRERSQNGADIKLEKAATIDDNVRKDLSSTTHESQTAISAQSGRSADRSGFGDTCLVGRARMDDTSLIQMGANRKLQQIQRSITNGKQSAKQPVRNGASHRCARKDQRGTSKTTPEASAPSRIRLQPRKCISESGDFVPIQVKLKKVHNSQGCGEGARMVRGAPTFSRVASRLVQSRGCPEEVVHPFQTELISLSSEEHQNPGNDTVKNDTVGKTSPEQTTKITPQHISGQEGMLKAKERPSVRRTERPNDVGMLFSKDNVKSVPVQQASKPTTLSPRNDKRQLATLGSDSGCRSVGAACSGVSPCSNINGDSARMSPSSGSLSVEPEPTAEKVIDDIRKQPSKDDPAYAKYFRMLKVGLPMGAVKNAMERDGLDPDIMDERVGGRGRDGAVSSVLDQSEPDRPDLSKYRRMIKIGLPMGAVKNAMERDGLDPALIEQRNQSSNVVSDDSMKTKSTPKDTHRRTRLHWDTLGEVRSNSIWAMVDSDPDVVELSIDETEFQELFQAEIKPFAISVIRKDVSSLGTVEKASRAVKVIDPKRANNGGIILARLKMTYDEMAVAIDSIDDASMTPEQLQGIIDYIPTQSEKKALQSYMSGPSDTYAEKFDSLCECEKFMVAISTVKHSKRKIRALLFKLQFATCFSELETEIGKVEKACDEVSNSIRFRKVLGVVLKIGNRLNTAGTKNRDRAGAFTIKSLLKLNEAKAFDQKTTLLQYVVLVLQRNNKSLLYFKDEIPTVFDADKIYLDQCSTELQKLEAQVVNVRNIALHQARRQTSQLSVLSPTDSYGSSSDSISEAPMTMEAPDKETQILRSTQVGIFTLGAYKQVSALREKVEITKQKFSDLLEYFGEDGRNMKSHELFGIISTFCKDFDASSCKEGGVEGGLLRV